MLAFITHKINLFYIGIFLYSACSRAYWIHTAATESKCKKPLLPEGRKKNCVY
jgi:hypothetical protein